MAQNKINIKIIWLCPDFSQNGYTYHANGDTHPIPDFAPRSWEVGKVQTINHSQLGTLYRLQLFGVLKFEKL